MSGRLLALVESKLVGADLAIEFERLGWEVEILRHDAIGIESFREFVRVRKPRFLLSINHSPELAWLATGCSLPYVSWTVDPLSLDRMRVLDGTDPALVRVFLHRSSQVAIFRAMGFPFVEWLPLAAPRRRFEQAPPPSAERTAPSFVGSSLRDEIALFEQALARWGIGGGDAEALRDAFDSFAAIGLDDAVFAGLPPGGQNLPARLIELSGEPAPVVAEAANARIAASFRRMRVRELASRGVAVHGDDGWTEIVGSAWKGALPDGVPLTRTYATSLASVDVPRLHQRDIATLRAFDVAASGGCLVAEPSEDLVRLFEPGMEFLAYRDGRELESVLERLALDPDLSIRIGRKALERAKAQHALEARVARIVSAIQ